MLSDPNQFRALPDPPVAAFEVAFASVCALLCVCGRRLDVFGHHRAACSRAGVLGRRGFAVESALAQDFLLKFLVADAQEQAFICVCVCIPSINLVFGHCS